MPRPDCSVLSYQLIIPLFFAPVKMFRNFFSFFPLFFTPGFALGSETATHSGGGSNGKESKQHLFTTRKQDLVYIYVLKKKRRYAIIRLDWNSGSHLRQQSEGKGLRTRRGDTVPIRHILTSVFPQSLPPSGSKHCTEFKHRELRGYAL